MKLIEITKNEEKEFADFVQHHTLGSIHQLPEWGKFQATGGGRDKYWMFAVKDEKGHILASALVIRQILPLKKCWLYCPRGPLADYVHPRALGLLLEKIHELARSQNAVFFRFDPPLMPEEKVDWKGLKTVTAHAHYQPENTLIIDLTQSPEELLKQMKPKGRYNIKVAEKHGVKIRESDGNEKDVEDFYRLFSQTTARDRFSGHPRQYYQNMITFLGHQKAKFYLAEYRPGPAGKPQTVAGMIVTHFKDTATYYFGASGNEHRNVMAPYLLQWHAIREAEKAGFKYYDFLGIAPLQDPATGEISPDHPWAGVTDFKLKFGGKRVDYQPAREIVYQPFWYFIIKILKRLRR
jgi:lipid II:glycine glycyltransferase (peptidoglycan interpeptide bridge formation enzyme)